MTPDEAPLGAVVTIGNPKNGVLAKKMIDGWHILVPSQVRPDFDDLHKTARLVAGPGYIEEGTDG